jgi:hypothetical protein
MPEGASKFPRPVLFTETEGRRPTS